MVTTISPHTTARHTGTTGPSGSTAACSSDPALGSTVLTTSTATWITVSIHITATMVHIPTMEAEAMEAGAIARKSDKLKANGCCVADPSAVARCWGDVPAL